MLQIYSLSEIWPKKVFDRQLIIARIEPFSVRAGGLFRIISVFIMPATGNLFSGSGSEDDARMMRG